MQHERRMLMLENEVTYIRQNVPGIFAGEEE